MIACLQFTCPGRCRKQTLSSTKKNTRKSYRLAIHGWPRLQCSSIRNATRTNCRKHIHKCRCNANEFPTTIQTQLNIHGNRPASPHDCNNYQRTRGATGARSISASRETQQDGTGSGSWDILQFFVSASQTSQNGWRTICAARLGQKQVFFVKVLG